MPNDIQVHVLSNVTIKPCTPTPDDKKCTELCLMDQFMPPFYVTLLLFYRTTESHKKLIQLKESLSETLTIFYPLAGRFKDNTSIDCNDEGIPFIEARVDCSVSELLMEPDVHLLQQFLPCKRVPTKPMAEISPVAIQVTTFTCGGLVIGTCFNHKIMDGASIGCFLKNWAAKLRGGQDRVAFPDFEFASNYFPPNKDIPSSCVEPLDTPETMRKLTRYVFNESSIHALKMNARSEKFPNPTRVEVVSAFLWKHLIDPTSSFTLPIPDLPTGILSLISHPINIRNHPTIPADKCCIGNIILHSVAAMSNHQKNQELDVLVGTLREAFKTAHNSRVKRVHSEDGLKELLMGVKYWTRDGHNVIVFVCSSWCRLGFDEIDFGWGKPRRVCPCGEEATLLDKNTFLRMDIDNGEGIEAWCFMEEQDTARLQRENEFLEFASPISRIITPTNEMERYLILLWL